MKQTAGHCVAFIAALLFRIDACAQSASAATSPLPDNASAGKVVISGTVPDEATKSVLIGKLQEVYGAGHIIDQLSVGGVTAPANWVSHVPKLITSNLKTISKGQLVIDGTTIAMRGEVGNDLIRQSIANEFASALNPTYTIKNGLRITASSQTILDQTLANRVIEFENGSALLTDSGKRILDEMTQAMNKASVRKIEIIGHTDDKGARPRNIALSLSRAESVKVYMVASGIAPQVIMTIGMGADQPAVSNDTEGGRKRNRRIEFRVSQ